ncbi:unnamed protein product [Rotaria sordida]|uniref:Uncharacterized protein n=1 Tax=Rotaria sordida TaxID=392033 RepID=A0A814QX99_9BILA|nr:unnamed protein product [Rotaria sordida]CAF1345265.1 unnamed protein product [Rotaria sordida]
MGLLLCILLESFNAITVTDNNIGCSKTMQKASNIDSSLNYLLRPKRGSASSLLMCQMTWSKTAITIAGMADGTEGNGQNQLSHPYTLAIGQNHEIYIADSHNNRIQKWTMNSGTGTTVAGNADGSSGLSNTALHFPAGIVLDKYDNMYFTDRENHRVMYWEKDAPQGSTYAGTPGNRF